MKVVALSQRHFEDFYKWHQDAHFNLMASWDARPKSPEDIAASYGRFLALPNFGLVAETDEDKSLAAFFAEIDFRIRSAEVHIVGSPASVIHSATAVKEAIDCGLAILFRDYGLESVRFRTLADNLRLRSSAEKYGFSYRGLFRSAVFVNGCSVDMVLYDMLQSEFQAKLKKGE